MERNITSLKPATSVRIFFKLNNKIYTFPTKVVGTKGRRLFLDVVRVKGYVLPLTSADLVIGIIAEEKNQQPVVWNGCALTTIKFKGKSYYCVLENEKAAPFNRRNYFRYAMVIDGGVMLGDHGLVKNCIVRDVSQMGMCLVIEKGDTNHSFEELKGMAASVYFSDLELGYDFKIHGEIVRVKETEKRYILGCSFAKESGQIGKYIALKQRHQQVLTSGTLAQKKTFKSMQKLRKMIVN